MKPKGKPLFRKFWITLKILTAIVFVIVVLLRFEIIGGPMSNMSFRDSDEKIVMQFKDSERIPTINYLKSDDRTIRYLTLINQEDLPYVVFIHGAPGSLSDYLNYFKDKKLSDQLNLISIDRPGYGYSDFGKSETSLSLQAKAVQKVIAKECKNNKILLIGHSYGGPVAIKMGMDYPENYKAIFLLAPAIDPQNEKVIKLAALPKYAIIRWLTPPAIRVAADEKNSHIKELKQIENDYGLIRVPIYHLHGDKDSLVPYENLAFSERKIKKELLTPISLKNVDHFLPWSHYDLITQKILEVTSTF